MDTDKEMKGIALTAILLVIVFGVLGYVFVEAVFTYLRHILPGSSP